ncbi:mannose-specific lectin-like [Phalaenopsis equestris]|uniref:mannose-specific lectin-like n=1 Tax=Phalaenopsis equestris TaxID=78828 RepID=UPI0009E3CDFD|nr:mannose-specific lectin-like [Phalaenopsis equestris]
MVLSQMIKSLLFAASLTILLADPSSAQTYNHLLSGERLNGGESLRSMNLQLIIQYDCNLVLYDSNSAIWASGTGGSGSGCYLAMQNDGNLVIYDYSNRAIWASNTGRDNGYYILVLQKDRNVVIYGNPIWATGTNYGGSVAVVVTAARNGTVGVSAAKQNKVRKMGKIMEGMI